MSALQLDSVHVALGGCPILQGVSQDVEPGEFLALVGPNGCGKSTLLRVLTGELRPDRGQALLQGTPVHEWPRREVARRVAVLHQQLPRVPGVSVRDLVAHGRYAHRGMLSLLRSPSNEVCERALADTGTDVLADRLVDSLSGGERQRVRLALALAQDAPILLLDEPTIFLDIGHQLEVLDLVTRLRDQRRLTVVAVLHDMDQAARYAARLVALGDGRVRADGPPASALTPGLLAEVFGVRGRRVPVAGLAALLVIFTDVRSGRVQPGAAMAAMVLTMTVLGPAAQIAGLVKQAGTLRAAVGRMVEGLDAEPVTTYGPERGDAPDPALGVRVRGVRFSYPDGPPVLREVDLDQRPGRTTALVGPSGCGKSTLVQLLLRLRTPQAGDIEVGGMPLAEVTEEHLRAFATPVLQDVDLFYGSLADTIRLGAPDADDAEVARAVRAAGLEDVVAELPEGLATMIGERGVGLSGGQRLRLAIARAIVTRAPVVILDEAVSHLDPRLEEDVVRRLRAVPGRAILVVAHRPATAAACDEVVDLGGGTTATKGTRP